METELFNLEKIKQSTKPIEKLEGKISVLGEIYKKFNESVDDIKKGFQDKNYLDQIKEIERILKDINFKLSKVSKENVNKFFFLRNNLIEKHKDYFKNIIKKIKLNQSYTKEIGLFLIKNKNVSKIVYQPSFIPTLTLNQWLDLLDSLKENSLFLLTVEKANNFYNNLIKKRLKLELSKIPKNIDPVLIKEFEKEYLKNHITFPEFLKIIENKLTKKELEAKKSFIEKTKEEERLEKLKRMQEEQQKAYQDYFNLSEKEFQRKMRKKKREKLSDLVDKPKNKNQLKISEEIIEKIEKFKSKFENNFEEKYLIRKEDEKDPLDLIRKRKRRKQEEYKDHIKKFKNKQQ